MKMVVNVSSQARVTIVHVKEAGKENIVWKILMNAKVASVSYACLMFSPISCW